ncbi:unnamed protein product, partial [Laminaria digitata]
LRAYAERRRAIASRGKSPLVLFTIYMLLVREAPYERNKSGHQRSHPPPMPLSLAHLFGKPRKLYCHLLHTVTPFRSQNDHHNKYLLWSKPHSSPLVPLKLGLLREHLQSRSLPSSPLPPSKTCRHPSVAHPHPQLANSRAIHTHPT